MKEYGSAVSLAVKADEIEDQFVQLTIYGQNRVGKTTLACQFEKPLVLISFEPNRTGGANSIKRIPGVYVVRVKYKKEKDNIYKQVCPACKRRFISSEACADLDS